MNPNPIPLSYCVSFVADVRRAGAPVPARLVELLDAASAVKAALDTDPSAKLAADLAAGNITGEAVVAAAREAAGGHAALLASSTVLEQTTSRIVVAFRDALDGETGEELVASLRPGFDAEAKALAACTRRIGPSPNADSILATGAPDEVVAWRDMPRHKAALDTVRKLLGQLETSFGLLGPSYGFTSPRGDASLAFVLANLPGNGLNAASRLEPGGRGGIWSTLVAHGYRLRINTPAEARDLLDSALLADDPFE